MVNRRRRTTTNTIRRLQRALTQIASGAMKPEMLLRRRAETVLAALTPTRVAILIANDRGRYIDANAAAARLTGYTRTELMRLSVWDLTPPVRLGLGRRLWREFLHRQSMSGEYRLRRKGGRLQAVRYVAVANVLPGVHVSALIAPTTSRTVRRRRRTAGSSC